MEIYLLRHGIAEDASQTGRDEDRALTAEGAERMRRSVAAMKALNVQPSHILSSPYLRAEQTARIAAEGLEVTRLDTSEFLVPHAPVEHILSELPAVGAGSIMLVGHEPHLGRLISLWISGSPDLLITMKKGGLCKLLCGGRAHPGSAALEWLLSPRHLLKSS